MTGEYRLGLDKILKKKIKKRKKYLKLHVLVFVYVYTSDGFGASIDYSKFARLEILKGVGIFMIDREISSLAKFLFIYGLQVNLYHTKKIAMKQIK